MLGGRRVKRQAPPLEAIEAFIVATRVPSFRMAADVLALSPSALSRRIQALEAFVGVTLFDREGGTVALTALGHRYLAEVEPALDAIRRATVDLKAERDGGALRVVTPQSFAIGWLLPRLSDFMQSTGATPIEIKIGHDASDLRRGLADVAILVGPLQPNGMETETIVELDAVIASSPKLSNGDNPPSSLAELYRYSRLAAFRPPGLWEYWLSHVGYDGPVLRHPTKFEAQFLVFEAAAAGLGVALAPPVLANRLFLEGRLVPCMEQRAPIGVSYCLVYADSVIQRRKDTRRFASWLRREVVKTQESIPASRPEEVDLLRA